MRRLALALLFGGAAFPAAAQPTAPSPRPVSAANRLEFCSVLRQCGLSAPSGCTPDWSAGVEDVVYDDDRCRDPKALHAGGVAPDTELGFRIYRFLGRRYRVAYETTGEVPVSAERVAYLLGELPFAARLLTHFQQTRYEAEYLDATRRRFKASKGDNLTGEAQIVAGGARERTLYFFGRGRSKLGPWKMSGISLVRFDFTPVPDKPRAVAWRARVLAAPENAFLNMVMNMGVFRRQVLKHLREVVDDMTTAAKALDGAPAGRLAGTWTAEEQAKAAHLRALP